MTATLETISCADCPTTWQRRRQAGHRPLRCADCDRAAKKLRDRTRAQTADDPTPKLASNVVRYRLAIEIAIPAIKIGRYKEALEALEAART